MSIQQGKIMKRKSAITFIVELLALFALLITVITVITVVSVGARGKSRDARVLTGAVLCAQNTAEMTAGASDQEEAAARLEQMENVSSVETDKDVISFRADPDAGDREGQSFDVKLRWKEEPSETGKYISRTIEVFEAGEAKPVYSLTSGRFIKNDTMQSADGGEETR